MSTGNCVIIGAGHAGVSLALQLRKEGWTGGIQLISAEADLPYHRPPLSKDLLAGTRTAEQIRLRPEQTYADNSIELLLKSEVTAIDIAARTVRLDNGNAVPYSKLALCTGARARILPTAEPRESVFYIRTLADIEHLPRHALPGKRAVLIGAGYIGLEAAAQLMQKGVKVTLLEKADRILNRVTAPAVSKYFAEAHASHGVEIHTGVHIEKLSESNQVFEIQSASGNNLVADFLVVGIGIIPNVELAGRAGLRVEQGIVVNEYAQTSDPHIYAAGDCTVHPSALYGRYLRLESVQNATDQARVAAANICGKNIQYDTVPWFWSDQYDIKLQTAGLHNGHDTVVVRGKIGNTPNSGFAVFYLQDGRLLAADCINRPKEFIASKQWIRNKARIVPEMLANAELELNHISG